MTNQDQEPDLEERLRKLADLANRVTDRNLKSQFLAQVEDLKQEIAGFKKKTHPHLFTSENQISVELYEKVDMHTVFVSAQYSNQLMMKIRAEEKQPDDYEYHTFFGRLKFYRDSHRTMNIAKLLDKLRKEAFNFASSHCYDAVLLKEADISLKCGIHEFQVAEPFRYEANVDYSASVLITLYRLKEKNER